MIILLSTFIAFIKAIHTYNGQIKKITRHLSDLSDDLDGTLVSIQTKSTKSKQVM